MEGAAELGEGTMSIALRGPAPACATWSIRALLLGQSGAERVVEATSGRQRTCGLCIAMRYVKFKLNSVL